MYVQWLGGPRPVRFFKRPEQYIDVRGVQHPAAVLATWNEDDLAKIDIYPLVGANIPNGQRLKKATYRLVNGRVIETATETEDRHSLGELKDQARSAVEDESEMRAAATFDFGSNTYVARVHETSTEIAAIGAFARRAVANEVAWPAGFGWPDAAGDLVVMTAQEFSDFADAALIRVMQIRAGAETHKAAIKAADTRAKLPDTTKGWPT